MQQNDPKTDRLATASATAGGISFPGIRILNAGENIDPRDFANGDFSDLARWSFFFDLDGTLLDLAPSPDLVKPEERLQAMLETLAERTSGALAIVSGRSVDFVDRLFPGYRFTVAGLHGAEIRQQGREGAGSEPSAKQLSDGFVLARENAKRAAERFPGVLFEDKGKAFALHYRLAPEREEMVGHIMREAGEIAGPDFALQEGKFVLELKPSGSDKGRAVRKLMEAEPFRGRRPFAAGDDHTDESMFATVNGMGGLSLRVGPAPGAFQTSAMIEAASPAIFRNWIRRLIA